jgi:hypothetical protein
MTIFFGLFVFDLKVQINKLQPQNPSLSAWSFLQLRQEMNRELG